MHDDGNIPSISLDDRAKFSENNHAMVPLETQLQLQLQNNIHEVDLKLIGNKNSLHDM